MSKGNVGYEMNDMRPARPARDTAIETIMRIPAGIVMGYTLITAKASLTVLCESVGERFANGCQIICVHSNAVTSTMWQNTGAVGSAPTFTSMIS